MKLKTCLTFSLLFILFSALSYGRPLVIGCTTGYQQSFYKKLKGTIGSIAVTMDLTRNKGILSGSYYYDKIGFSLYLNGTIKSDGSFEMKESNENGDVTGKFTGTFSSPQSIEGNWTNSENKQKINFSLTQTYTGVVSATFEEYYKQNCAVANENKRNITAETIWWDTACTSIKISLVKIKSADQASSDLINQSIKYSIYNQDNTKYNSILKYLDRVNEVTDGGGYNEEISCWMETNDQNILSIQISNVCMWFGAMHPLASITFYNFDSRTGRQIKLNELLLPGFKNTLDRIGEKKLFEKYGTEGWSFELGKFELSSNFSITTGGLLFLFGQYEIGPYAMGTPTVLIAYKDINNLINPNGGLATFGNR